MNKCPKCKREYNEYPMISKVDNKTEICQLCGETEAMVIITAGRRKVNMTTNELSEIEKGIRKSIIELHERMKPYVEKAKIEERSRRIKIGIQNKKRSDEK